MGYKPLNMFYEQTNKLKRLIQEYPDYPIVVVCGYEVVCDDGGWWYAPSLSFSIGEILDCEQDIDEEKVYVDRDDFEEDVRYCIECIEEYAESTDEEFEELVKDQLEKYEPYWRQVIQIRADV